MSNAFRCGDIVFHRPSQEEWLVAWCEGDDLAWCGWPNGMARTADCELVKACTDEGHINLVRVVANCGDSRASKVKYLYPYALPQASVA